MSCLQVIKENTVLLSSTCKFSIGQVGSGLLSMPSSCDSLANHEVAFKHCFCPNALETSNQMYRIQQDSGRLMF